MQPIISRAKFSRTLQQPQISWSASISTDRGFDHTNIHNFAPISLSMGIYAHVGGIFCVDYRDNHQAYQRQLWCSTREPHHGTPVVHGGHRTPQLEPSPPLSRNYQLTNVSVSAAAGLKLDQRHANRFPRFPSALAIAKSWHSWNTLAVDRRRRRY